MSVPNAYTFLRVEVINQGHNPDGDTIWFMPRVVDSSNSEASKLIKSCRFTPEGELRNKDGSCSARFEAIDATETHYYSKSQPVQWAEGAKQKMLELVNSTGRSANGSPEIWLASKGTDAHGRLICFLITDQGAKKLPKIVNANSGEKVKVTLANMVLIHGAEFMVTPDVVDDTVNADELRAGVVYPMYYNTLAPDLRVRLTQIYKKARKSQLGLWGTGGDQTFTEAGAAIYSLNDIYNVKTIFPKLFRRVRESVFSTSPIPACQTMADDIHNPAFLELCFVPWFAQNPEESVCIVDPNRASNSCLKKVDLDEAFTIDLANKRVKANYQPEQMVFE